MSSPDERQNRKAEIEQILAQNGYLTDDQRAKVLMYFLGTTRGILDNFDSLIRGGSAPVIYHLEQAEHRLTDAFLRMEQAMQNLAREIAEAKLTEEEDA